MSKWLVEECRSRCPGDGHLRVGGMGSHSKGAWSWQALKLIPCWRKRIELRCDAAPVYVVVSLGLGEGADVGWCRLPVLERQPGPFPQWELCVSCCCQRWCCLKDDSIVSKRNEVAGRGENEARSAKLHAGPCLCHLTHESVGFYQS